MASTRDDGGTARGEPRRRTVLAVVGVVAVVAGILLAVVFGALHRHSVRSHQQVAEALTIARELRVIDGLEWRAVAGQDPDGMAAAIAASEARIERGIARLGVRAGPLDAAADRYVDAVRQLLTALEAGDLEAAVEIDQTLVDPNFADTTRILAAIVAAESEEARRTDRQVSALIWFVSIGVVVLLGVAAAVAAEARRRRAVHQQRVAHQRRLGALIERSTDVITVVSGTDDLDVVSPGLRTLADVAQDPVPRRVAGLLPPEPYLVWQEADALLRRSARPHDLELTIERAGAAPLHIEAHGAVLDAAAGERVWTWRDVTEKKELAVQLAHEAFHDSLTGVANRALMLERIGQALRASARNGTPVTTLFCNLDNFKAVNDALGHRSGDALLRAVAGRMEESVRDVDTVARLGGDEFAVLTESDPTHATALAERLRAAVNTEVELDGHVVIPSMSVGIATAGPRTTTPEQLLQSADLAMYAAKQAGKGQLSVFREDMYDSALATVELQDELRSVVRDEQLVLHHQPIVDLHTGRVEGVEALVRWQHPRLGLLPPDRFVPLAEATGQMLDIGRWILRAACRAAVELQALHGSHLHLSVNLSPQQLHSPGIVPTVEQALHEAGLAADHLQLEVTEGHLLDDRVAIERLRQLCRLGVRIAVDDFGTGYASIHYLQTLPIDVLKIDRSFVSGGALVGPQRTAFLNAIVSLTQALHLGLVAEGVEEEQQRDTLRELGCRLAQGWLWSPALPLPEVSTVIRGIEDSSPAGRATTV